MGVGRTTLWWTRRICRRLSLTWGYDWQSTRPDPNFEVSRPLADMRQIARRVEHHRR